ncbi:MAG TPA: carboxypeptidase-like regulatory domain-containing protein, partial [Gillisia sp.]|nr:carboxypeptidase-like regulatory domain-containing protein [Gillisia sp.]
MKGIFFTICLFSIFHAWSQTRAGGVVKDVAGVPVPFVNVIFPNSSEGTITSEDGRFYINSPKDHDSLRFTFVGYRSQTIPLKKGNNAGLEIILQEESQGLSEVWIFQGKTSKKNNPAL